METGDVPPPLANAAATITQPSDAVLPSGAADRRRSCGPPTAEAGVFLEPELRQLLGAG